jgi:hypothetical protein
MNVSSRNGIGSVVLALCLVLSGHAKVLADVLPDKGATTVFLPAGDLFHPLLADPKEPHFYLSYRYYIERTQSYNASAGGFGEIFGLTRTTDTSDGSAWQANFSGAVHALFNLDMHSRAIVNADYTIGFPVSYRNGPDSARIFLYHQSSHLGDEYMVLTGAKRIEFAYEALNVIGSHEWQEWRIYGGGEYLLHRVPQAYHPMGLQAGVEYYGARVPGWGRPVGGLDLKSEEEHHWALNASLKAGFQFDSSEPNGRYMRVLLEAYNGFSQHGQFFPNRISYGGFGVALGFD